MNIHPQGALELFKRCFICIRINFLTFYTSSLEKFHWYLRGLNTRKTIFLLDYKSDQAESEMIHIRIAQTIKVSVLPFIIVCLTRKSNSNLFQYGDKEGEEKIHNCSHIDQSTAINLLSFLQYVFKLWRITFTSLKWHTLLSSAGQPTVYLSYEINIDV